MENKETIVTLKNIEEKISKSGRHFFSVETEEQGKLTAFDKPIVDNLKKFIGKQVRIEMAENEQGFKNVRKFLGEVVEDKVRADYEASKGQDYEAARKLKDQSIYTSYAKDVFIASLGHIQEKANSEVLMTEAIALIKQAKDAFGQSEEEFLE